MHSQDRPKLPIASLIPPSQLQASQKTTIKNLNAILSQITAGVAALNNLDAQKK